VGQGDRLQLGGQEASCEFDRVAELEVQRELQIELHQLIIHLPVFEYHPAGVRNPVYQFSH
jgi:hypothetical protein